MEHVGLWTMDQLALPTVVEQLGIGASLRAAAIGSILPRMERPGSQRATGRWLGERSALGDYETAILSLKIQLAFSSPVRLGRNHPHRASCRTPRTLSRALRAIANRGVPALVSVHTSSPARPSARVS